MAKNRTKFYGRKSRHVFSNTIVRLPSHRAYGFVCKKCGKGRVLASDLDVYNGQVNPSVARQVKALRASL